MDHPPWCKWSDSAVMTENEEFLLNSGTDAFYVVVDRTDVENGNIEPTLAVLRQLLVSPATVRSFMDRVHLAFAGYDEDARELHQIQDVRSYTSKLDDKFPFWFYFINLHDDMLLVIQLILCKYTTDEQNGYVVDTSGLETFMTKHFLALNWLIEKFGLGEELIELRSRRIDAFFSRKRERPKVH